VQTRQAQVDRDYRATAARLDSLLHPASTPPGPFTLVLNGFGLPHDNRVLGPVVGVFGESSSDLREIRNLIAHQLADRRCAMIDGLYDQTVGLFTSSLDRKWGHLIARGWSRLILARARDQVGPLAHQRASGSRSGLGGSSAAHTAHESWGYHNRFARSNGTGPHRRH